MLKFFLFSLKWLTKTRIQCCIVAKRYNPGGLMRLLALWILVKGGRRLVAVATVLLARLPL